MTKTVKEMIEVMEWFEGGGDVECVEIGYDNWEKVTEPLWNWDDFDYRIKEFQYPMWFKCINSDMVVRFDSLKTGEVIISGVNTEPKGQYLNYWTPHTVATVWTEIKEPKEKSKEKVTIEKWLIEENNIKVVIETSDIDSWLESFPTTKKLKLIEKYEVEI